jgi:uncharacterized BrkB/YihY/UPF0761 family membrane protein
VRRWRWLVLLSAVLFTVHLVLRRLVAPEEPWRDRLVGTAIFTVIEATLLAVIGAVLVVRARRGGDAVGGPGTTEAQDRDDPGPLV